MSSLEILSNALSTQINLHKVFFPVFYQEYGAEREQMQPIKRKVCVCECVCVSVIRKKRRRRESIALVDPKSFSSLCWSVWDQASLPGNRSHSRAATWQQTHTQSQLCVKTDKRLIQTSYLNHTVFIDWTEKTEKTQRKKDLDRKLYSKCCVWEREREREWEWKGKR